MKVTPAMLGFKKKPREVEDAPDPMARLGWVMERAEAMNESVRTMSFPPSNPNDKRGATREGVWSVSQIVHPSGHKEPCVIIEYSETGARIKFRSRVPLPKTVYLISKRPKLELDAQVIWQDIQTAGLRFELPESANQEED